MKFTTPCYIVDLDRLFKNLRKISKLQSQTGCKVLLALKGHSTAETLPFILEHLDGLSASGAFEAKLSKEFDAVTSTFAPAYPPDTFPMVVENSDMLVFNSFRQFQELAPTARRNGVSCGIRINPQYSELPEDMGANPCRKSSHLGVLKEVLPPLAEFGPGKIEGIHLHTMCAQYADTLEHTIHHLIEQFKPYLERISWINLGGGQLYGDDDYDMDRATQSIRLLKKCCSASIFVEPCEGILTQCGFLATRVLDVVHNDIDIAILDSSAICHLSDAVYRGWSRDVLGAGEPDELPYNIRLAGCSCYAGDIFGDYSFPAPLQIGDLVIFQDAAVYTAVKACMFNGIPLPQTALYSKRDGLSQPKHYDYDLFRQTL